MNNKFTINDSIPQDVYNEDYYERGLISGVSGYMNFSWMPELTLRMAHFMVVHLGLKAKDTVLDYGCAKGFLVKALRLLNIQAHGVDVSEYAIENVDSSVKKYCRQVVNSDDPALFPQKYSWLISKDVFEHIPEPELRKFLTVSRKNVEKMFVVVPLSADDTSGKYIIPEYDNDITHVIMKTKGWWSKLFEDTGWGVESFNFSFPGCKENWTKHFPDGNGFYILKAK
jgi:hypothetical protein